MQPGEIKAPGVSHQRHFQHTFAPHPSNRVQTMRLSGHFTRVVLAVSLLAVTSEQSATAVTYGNTVENPPVEYPEVVPVWFSGGMCSGTLIEQQVVLTAAHCVYGQSGPFQISVGGRTLSSGTRIDVNATWYHPRYDEEFAENDVGLLHLTKPAGVAQVATLPRSRTAPKPPTFTLVGWGLDQNGRSTGNLTKLRLDNYESLTKKSYDFLYNSKTMIGAGRFFRSELLFGGACRGDSGGPLFKGSRSHEVIGITSWGSAKGCTVYKPSVFVRVPYHLQTIRTAIATLKTRAQQTPIAVGTPSSGQSSSIPAATTTTAPAPLSVVYTTQLQRYGYGNPGITGTFSASVDIVKWCVTLDGQPLPDYRYVTGKGFSIDYSSTPTQSGGAGCYEMPGYSYNKKSVYIDGPSGLDAGRHSLVVTAYDALGRSASSPSIEFNGKLDTAFGKFYPGGFSTRTRTGEIEMKVTATNSYTKSWSPDSYVVKVCHTVTRDGVAVTNMTGGFWALSEPNCVTNPSTTPATSNESSAVIPDPAGTQRWSVVATIYNSAGATVTTDSYWFAS